MIKTYPTLSELKLAICQRTSANLKEKLGGTEKDTGVNIDEHINKTRAQKH